MNFVTDHDAARGSLSAVRLFRDPAWRPPNKSAQQTDKPSQANPAAQKAKRHVNGPLSDNIHK
ncbi:hypothetical protein CC2G_011519 [Coprinopsis cinerea AmutBmut pab1-1]|nr:hypothetical protein CC2G_011519 [Coprinopsis cinerea AmutBmut pab1-1]